MADLPEGYLLVDEQGSGSQPQNIIPSTRGIDVPLGFEESAAPSEGRAEQFLIGTGRGFQNRLEGYEMFFKNIEAFTAMSSEERNKVLAEIAKRKQEITSGRKEFQSSPVGQQPAAKAGEVVGELLSDAPIRGPRAATATGRALSAGATGAVLGLTQYADKPEDAALNATLGMMFGSGTSLAFDTARINANIIQSRLRRALKVPDIARTFEESQKLSAETGIDFTLGQATGSRSLLSFENVAINSEGASDAVIGIRNNQLRQAIRFIDSQIKKIGDPKATPETVGNDLKRGVDTAVDRITSIRTRLWDRHMDRAISEAGDAPVGTPVNTMAKLDSLIEELDNPLAPYPESIKNEFMKIREKASNTWTVMDFKNALKKWGALSAGTGRPFKDLDTADQRRLFGELVSAVGDDMDAIINNRATVLIGGKPFPFESKAAAIQYLKLARQSWKINSEKIAELENTVLGQAINKGGRPLAPEEIYKRVRTMPASEVRKLVPTLNKVSPSIINNVKVRILKDAMDNAKLGPAAPESLIDLDPAKFVTNLRDQDNVVEFFSGTDMKEYLKTIQAMKRIADRSSIAGGGQSPLGSQTEAGGLIGGAIETGGLPNIVFLGRFLAKNLTPERYAKLLMTKEGQQAIQTISKWNQVPRDRLVAATGVLAGIINEPDVIKEEE